MTDQNRVEDTQPDENGIGVTIPDEHVGAFVAEAFEDAERSTDWREVVDAMVAPSAREEWEQLTPREQVVEVLSMADDYDAEAVDRLRSIETDGGRADEDVRRRFREATRYRRNADALRDGVAAAYGEGYVDDEGLVAAVETFEFDTDRIARREEELDRVANAYDFSFSPYGGTLFGDAAEEEWEEFEPF